MASGKGELRTDSVKEFRVRMPMTVGEYEPGHLYVVAQMSRETREELGEGAVQVLANAPFFDDARGGRGQYTRKRFHIGAKLPAWLAAVTPDKALWVEEEAWNCFPQCHTVLTSPYFTSLRIVVDTRVHDADAGAADNPHGLSRDELACRTIEYIDIARPRSDDDADAAATQRRREKREAASSSKSSWWSSLSLSTSSSSSSAAAAAASPAPAPASSSASSVAKDRSGCVPPAAAPEEAAAAAAAAAAGGDGPIAGATPWTFRSLKAERGPLVPGWEKSAASQGVPVLCVYKLVRVEPPYLPGLRAKLRAFIQSYFGSLFYTSHARMFTALDDYYGLSLDQVRALELDSHPLQDAATLP